MPLSMTPGSSIIASPELRCRHGLRRDLSSSALPILPAIRFTRGKYFGASRFTHLLRPAKLLAPLYGSDRHARPPGAFTSRLPTDRLPSPLLGITTAATGLLCWRDSHPLEWQLASLHQNRTCGFPAYGSHLGCVTAKLPYTLQRLCHASLVLSPVRALLVRIPLGPRPSLHRLRCVRLRRCLRSGLASLCSPASQLLWRGPTSRARASSARTPRLPDADRPSHATLTARPETSQLPVRSFCT